MFELYIMKSASYSKCRHYCHQMIQWSASYRWSIGPNSALGSKETTNIGKTHLALFYRSRSGCQTNTARRIFISIVVDRSTALIEAVILGTDKASHRVSVTWLKGSYEHIWSCYSRQKPISIGVWISLPKVWLNWIWKRVSKWSRNSQINGVVNFEKKIAIAQTDTTWRQQNRKSVWSPGQFDEEVLQRKVYIKQNVRAQRTQGVVELGHDHVPGHY